MLQRNHQYMVLLGFELTSENGLFWLNLYIATAILM